VAGRVVVLGDLPERYEIERLLTERHPELHVETVGLPWEMVERATGDRCDLALVLKGPITAHEQRMDTIASLRRNGFAGKILFAGAFLTEKQDAVRAGADYAFDPDKQVAEQVVAAALYRPVVAADHPYLRYLPRLPTCCWSRRRATTRAPSTPAWQPSSGSTRGRAASLWRTTVPRRRAPTRSPQGSSLMSCRRRTGWGG